MLHCFHLHLEVLQFKPVVNHQIQFNHSHQSNTNTNCSKRNNFNSAPTSAVQKHIRNQLNFIRSHIFHEFNQTIDSDSLSNRLNSLSLRSNCDYSDSEQSKEEDDEDSVVFVNTDRDGILAESLDWIRSRSSNLHHPLINLTSKNTFQINWEFDYRKGPISIDWPVTNISSDTMSSPSNSDDQSSMVAFMTGYTEIHSGVLHLLREKLPCSSETNLPAVVCILGVPNFMTPADLLNFIGREWQSDISHFRIIRDSQKTKFMVLIRLRSAESAKSFYLQFNGHPFSVSHSELCHVVFVRSVQCTSSELAETFQSSTICPSTSHSLETGSTSSDLIELPTCPVCLERMDASVSGLLTIQCNHSFHCQCLSRWEDNRCPVCRFNSQQPNSMTLDGVGEEEHVCAMCPSSQNLWICLICGHLGCGRYQSAHAYEHFRQTGHLFAMELETQRVWDYGGDGYVHRLIQDKTGGRVVELPPPTLDGQASSGIDVDTYGKASYKKDHSKDLEKYDDLALEFAHLLTSSLETQRNFFETQLNEAANELSFHQHRLQMSESKHRDLNMNITRLLDENQTLHSRISARDEECEQLTRELDRSQTAIQKLQSSLTEASNKYETESKVTKQLLANQPHYSTKISQLELELRQKSSEIEELQDQVRDLALFLESRDKLQEAIVADQNVIIRVPAASASKPISSIMAQKRRKKR